MIVSRETVNGAFFMIAFSKQIVRLPKAVVLKLKKRLTIREITRKVKGFHFDKWYFLSKG